MLRRLAEALGAKFDGKRYTFLCPLCQVKETKRDRWRGEIRPGNVQVALLTCKRCGPSETEKILAAVGLGLDDINKRGTKEEIESEWGEATGGMAVTSDPALPPADRALIASVYRDLLEECPLLPEHEEWLEGQGITIEMASEFGYVSWPPPEKALKKIQKEYGEKLLQVPGFLAGGKISTGKARGIVIPCLDRYGMVFAFKIRYPKVRGDGKYILLSSAPNGPKGIVGVHWTNVSLGHDFPVWVVEGERKADVFSHATNLPCCSIPGVGMGHLLREEIQALGIKQVILALDRDEAGKQGAINVALQIGDLVEIGNESWDDTYKGLDDAIVARIERKVVWDDSWLPPAEEEPEVVAMSEPTPSAEEEGKRPPFALIGGCTGSELVGRVFPPLRWAIESILPAGLSVVAGKPKIGKSFLALDIAASVATGGSVLGKKVERGDSLYLAFEDTGRRIQSRLKGMGLTTKDLSKLHLYWHGCGWPRWDGGFLDGLRWWLDDHPETRLVLIDTLAKIRPFRTTKDGVTFADERIAEELFELANERQLSVVLLHHTKKTPVEDQWDAILGSTAFQGIFDGMLLLQRFGLQGTLAVKGREVEEHEVFMDWNSDLRRWEASLTTVPFESSLPADQWLVKTLANGPMLTVELQVLATEAGYSWMALRRAKDAMGNIRATKKGRQWYWELYQESVKDQIRKLEDSMQLAIEEERYEFAQQLKGRIEELKAKQKKEDEEGQDG